MTDIVELNKFKSVKDHDKIESFISKTDLLKNGTESKNSAYCPVYSHININRASFGKNEEDGFMDWQEEYIKKLNQDLSEIKSEMRSMESRLGDKIDTKLEEFRNEMRHLDNQRVEDMREIRNSLESTNERIQSMASNVHNIAIAAILGIAAIAVSVIGIWYSVVNK